MKWRQKIIVKIPDSQREQSGKKRVNNESFNISYKHAPLWLENGKIVENWKYTKFFLSLLGKNLITSCFSEFQFQGGLRV